MPYFTIQPPGGSPIEIRVRAYQVPHIALGQVRRSFAGRLRSSVTSVRPWARAWDLETSILEREDADALLEALTVPGVHALDGIGPGDEVSVFVTGIDKDSSVDTAGRIILRIRVEEAGTVPEPES